MAQRFGLESSGTQGQKVAGSCDDGKLIFESCKKAGSFLSNWATVSFSRSQLHIVCLFDEALI